MMDIIVADELKKLTDAVNRQNELLENQNKILAKLTDYVGDCRQ